MNYKKYICVLAAAAWLVLPSCDSALTEIKPQQDLTDTEAFINKGAAESTLLGVYSTAQILEVYGSMPQVINDFMADNGSFVGSFPTLQELRDFNGISTNANVAGIWQNHYRVIMRANLVIANVPTVNDVTFAEADKAQYIGEAKFMRALAYFQLVNLFAQPYQVSQGSNEGVPLVLEPFSGEVLFPKRSTVNEVHTQIKTDLTDAIGVLPESYKGTNATIYTRGRATKGAARALLSRLHLYREEWQQAADLAKQVLDAKSLYAPATDYSFWSAKNTTEDVFTIQNSGIDNGRTGSGGWGSYHRPAANGGRGDVPFSASLIAAYNEEPNDRRFALRSTGVAADAATSEFSTKWSDAVNNTDNSPVIRTTEVILNYVEAKSEVGGVTQELIDQMNVLRTRAGLPSWTLEAFASKEAFVTAVLNERRKELAFEGHRRMDLLRRRQNLRPNLAAAAFGAPKTILPIPQRELDINVNLAPNPGY